MELVMHLLSSLARSPRVAAAIIAVGAPRLLSAQNAATRELPLHHAPEPTAAAITPADLMTRLYIFSDDSMQGRRVGTEGHRRGTAYIEREVRRLGLLPAGDSGGYFQDLPVFERTLVAGQKLSVGGATFEPWVDYLPRDNGRAARDINNVTVVYGGVWGDTSTMIPPAQAVGKFIVMVVPDGP